MLRYGLLTTTLLVFIAGSAAFSQITIKGTTIDAVSKKALPYVNIGIRHKSIGTISHSDGAFSVNIPQQNESDTLTFSMVGYTALNIAINNIGAVNEFELREKTSQLNTVIVPGKKLVEEKFGIVKYHPLVHFIDGSTNQNDIFEIAQLIKLDTTLSKITSVNLYIGAARKDSGVFRINFYGFDGRHPTNSIFEKSIIQTHLINKGWLKFDLKKYGIYLKGDFVVAIEFLPSEKKAESISYEVKLGGSAKSFSRSQSQGDWRIPPHHYRMFVTALATDNVQKWHRDNAEEKETLPAARLFSASVQDTFSVFIKVPQNYVKNKFKHYPIVYLLDANAYFDHVSDFISDKDKNKFPVEPILVGIGYADFIQNDSLRDRDYTYPIALPADSFKVSGGANKFLNFLEKELIPFIDSTYRVDTSNRTIMGHSLGGYFTLYAMEREIIEKHNLFRNFVAASPSLSYHNEYLLGILADMPENKQIAMPRTLYVTVGGLENEDEVNSIEMPEEFNSFIRRLSTKRQGEVNIKSEVYSDFSHMETAVRTFDEAIHWLMMDK
ncbi:putative alpha/beta superfamily hydrolase [Chitinophaga niastensis]|uniref:Putative alpha/beta superfamily hydrolase n=1 Tax=Chitinophaga niastensis TaxID=536980 RepID=A0A2P8HDI6_CHINA|nr:alpha/beta hydrolase-fold protein [Chitinophaga niastensis]PSL44294.1 putative alpha/beta superfamily hydrolase [Chitinophaga niastensis]